MKRRILSTLLSKAKPAICVLAALLALVPSLAMPVKVLAVPLAPTALTAALAVDPVTLLPTRNINLTWTDNANNEVGFYVYRDTVNTFNSLNLVKVAVPAFVAPVPQTVPPTVPTYTEVAPVSGGTFFYKVTSYDGTGESLPTNVRTLVVASATPTGLTAVRTNRNIVLTWVSNSALTELGFRVFRDTVNTFNSPNIKIITTGPGIVTATDLAGVTGGTYFYRVAAFDLKTQSAYSATVQLVVPAAPPTGLTATIPAGTTNVLLSWVSNSAGAELGFYVEGDTVNTFNSANLMQTTVGNGVTSYIDSPALAGSWFYRVSAYDLAGRTANSNVATIVAPSGVGVPATPTNLVAKVMTGTRVDLTWTDNAVDETAYQVQRATNNTFTTGLTTFNLAANIVAYSNTNAVANTTYFYRVSCSNAAGTSQFSNVVQTRTAIPTAPTAVTAVAAGATQVDLTWTSPVIPNQTTFLVQRAPDNAGVAGTFAQIGTSLVTTYSDTTVAAGTKYWYRIIAQNGLGNSPALTAVTVTTPAAPTVPAAPTNLVATPVSTTQVDLTWTDVATTETGYIVKRATNAGFTLNLVTFPTLAAGAVSYSDTTAAPATAYFYRVVATNAVGDSAPPTDVSATTLSLAPAAPTGLAATVVPPNVRLDWVDNSSNETGFVVQRAANLGFTVGLTTFPATAAGVVTYLDLTAAPATTYFYRVKAVNSGGDSLLSNVVSATTPAIGVPDAPTTLAATPISSTQVNLTWVNVATNQTGLRLERATDSGFTQNFAQYVLSVTASSYSDMSAIPGATNYYRIIATNAAGDSVPSNTASALTTNALPLAPSNLTAVMVSTSQINLTWADNSNNEANFSVWTAVDASFTTGLVTIPLPANTTSFSDSSVYPGDTFYYKVYAFNAIGSSVSNTVSVTIPLAAPGVPARPMGLVVSLAAGNQVDLAWLDNATNETGYTVERALDNLFTSGVTTFVIAENSTTYSDTAAMPTTTYYYRVTAFNVLGNSVQSNIVSILTANIAVAAPTELIGNVSGATQISLGWVDNAVNETGYQVDRATDVAFTAGLISFPLPINSKSYNSTGLVAGTIYFYRVIALNPSGNSAPSNTVSIRAGAPFPPSGLAGVSTTPNSVNLTWVDAANNELSYTVQRSSNPTFTLGITPFTLPANSTTFTDAGLMSVTAYSYRVSASNAAGSSAFSNVVTVTTLAPVPPPLGNLTARAATATSVALTWVNTAPAQTTSIRIERAADAAFTTGFVTFTSGAATLTYTDATALANTTYYYRVFAVNAAGPSSPSNTASVTTPATTPAAVPAAPTALTATLISNNQINLAWTHAGTNVDGFHINTTSDPAFLNGVVTFTVPAAVRTYSDLSVFPGATFYYRVTAFNVRGDSGNSNTVTLAIPAVAVGRPPTPTGLGVTVVSSTELQLTWVDNAASESGFLLYRATNAQFTTGIVTFAIPMNTNTFVDDTVSPGVLYFYRICSYNALGTSANSSAISASTTGSVIPDAPINLSASAVTATQINLTWTDNSTNETNFRLERSTDPAFPAGFTTISLPAATAVPPTTVSYNNTGLTQLTTYYYRVFAFNAVGDSVVSNTASATTLSATAPAQPTGLAAVLILPNAGTTTTQVSLTWTVNGATATGLKIDRATSADFLTNLVTVNLSYVGGAYPPGVQSYNDATVAIGNRYYYQVTATNPSGPSAPSNSVIVDMRTPAAPTGLGRTVVGPTRVDLVWTDNASTEDGFQIERAINSNFSTGLTTFYTGANVTSYSDTTVQANTIYFYRVLAFSQVFGSSGFSGTVGAATSNVLPVAPINLRALPVSTTRIDLAWNNVGTNRSGFRIERALNIDFNVSLITLTIPGGSQVSYSDTSPAMNTTYYYRVTAYNGAGNSTPSGIAVATTPNLPPAASTGLTATPISASQVNLSWTNNYVGTATLRVERATNNTFTAFLTTFDRPAGTTSYNDTSVSSFTTYYYRVFAINSVGTSPASGTVGVTTPDVAAAAPALSAQVITGTWIDLSWVNNSTNQTGFRLERALDSGFTSSKTTINLPALSLSYSDNTVAVSTTYYYRIYATNTIGDSPVSNVVTIATPAALPAGIASAPSSLAAQAVSTTTANLTWTDNSTIEDGFRVERAPDVAGVPGTWAAVGTVIANVTNYLDSTLTLSTTYHYRVFATTVTGDSLSSNVAKVTTASNPAYPSAPINLTAVLQAGPPSGILVSWTNTAASQKGLRLTRANNSTLTLNPTTFTLPASYTSYLDTSVVSGRIYFYSIMALGSNSPPSNVSGVIVPPAAPANPAGLSAQAIGTTQVNLTWTDTANNETGYRIEQSADDSFTVVTSFGLSANTTSFNDTGLTPGSTYFYRILAFNDGGDSLPSITANATTSLDAAVPAASSGLTAAPVSASRVDLTWVSNSDNETGFRIEQALDDTFNSVTETVIAAGVTSYTDSGLAPATTYFYRVFAINASGDSLVSNTSSAATPDIPPAAPTELATSSVSANQVSLVWTDNSDNESGFRIERATDSAFEAGLETFTASSGVTAYTDTSAVGATTYYYRMFATNATGTSPESNTVTATVGINPPAAPTGPAAPASLNAVKVSDTQIDLTWVDNASDELGFHIETEMTAENVTTPTWNPANVMTITVDSPGTAFYSDTTVFAGGWFHYRVTAYNPNGDSAPSNVVSILIPAPIAGIPATPTSLAFAVTGTKVDLTWADNSAGEAGFQIDRDMVDTFDSASLVSFMTGADVLTYSDTTVNAGTTYYYRVRAFNAIGLSANPTFVTVPVGGTTTVTGGGAPVPGGSAVSVTGFTSSSGTSVNASGVTQSAMKLTIPGGDVSLTVPMGTKMLGKDGTVLLSITHGATVQPPTAPPESVILATYSFGPDGATFSPAITITMRYDGLTLPEGVTEDDLRIATWDGSTWQILETTVNRATRMVSASVSHFSSFVVIAPASAEGQAPESAPATGTTQPTRPAAPASQPAPTTNAAPVATEPAPAFAPDNTVGTEFRWWMGLVGVGVVGLIGLLMLRRRRSSL